MQVIRSYELRPNHLNGNTGNGAERLEKMALLWRSYIDSGVGQCYEFDARRMDELKSLKIRSRMNRRAEAEQLQ